jgi:hypothetical protein
MGFNSVQSNGWHIFKLEDGASFCRLAIKNRNTGVESLNDAVSKHHSCRSERCLMLEYRIIRVIIIAKVNSYVVDGSLFTHVEVSGESQIMVLDIVNGAIFCCRGVEDVNQGELNFFNLRSRITPKNHLVWVVTIEIWIFLNVSLSDVKNISINFT